MNDRGQWAPQIVRQRAEQQMSSALYPCRIPRHRFGERLVDAFVEANQLLEILPIRVSHLAGPKANDARAQRPIFGDHFVERKAVDYPGEPMSLCRRIRARLRAAVAL